MNRLRLVSLALACGLILSACGAADGTAPSEESLDTVSTSEVDATDGTSTSESDSEPTSDAEPQADASEATEVGTDTDTETEDSESESEEVSEETPSEELEATPSGSSTLYGDLVVPIQCNSGYVTEAMCSEVAEYFDAMVRVDVDAFESKQLSAYNAYIESYLEDNDSTVYAMLSTYRDNFLQSSGVEGASYSDVQFNSITLDYPNDTDDILSTMQYVYQLDEVTAEYEGYAVSDALTAYYELDYSIDYTITGEGVDDYTATKAGSVLLLDVDGDLSLLMLS